MAYRLRNNAVVDKTFYFSCECVKFADMLRSNRDFEFASQLHRAGTSVGANTRESQRAVSKKDFVNKLGIALKEAEEVEFWLDVMNEVREYDSTELMSKTDEVIRLLVSIIKKSSQNS